MKYRFCESLVMGITGIILCMFMHFRLYNNNLGSNVVADDRTDQMLYYTDGHIGFCMLS